MNKQYLISITLFLIGSLSLSNQASARECHLPQKWGKLCHVLQNRVCQTSLKMKLQEQDAKKLEEFLNTTHQEFPQLVSLQQLLPKTATELLLSICQRGVPKDETESIAAYLQEFVHDYQFQNVAAFDNNTSHIIGREWHEIDYTGEGMTWQKQKKHYVPYGVDNFKSLACLRKFFAVESKLPYFKKIYKPKKVD